MCTTLLSIIYLNYFDSIIADILSNIKSGSEDLIFILYLYKQQNNWLLKQKRNTSYKSAVSRYNLKHSENTIFLFSTQFISMAHYNSNVFYQSTSHALFTADLGSMPSLGQHKTRHNKSLLYVSPSRLHSLKGMQRLKRSILRYFLLLLKNLISIFFKINDFVDKLHILLSSSAKNVEKWQSGMD